MEENELNEALEDVELLLGQVMFTHEPLRIMLNNQVVILKALKELLSRAR